MATNSSNVKANPSTGLDNAISVIKTSISETNNTIKITDDMLPELHIVPEHLEQAKYDDTAKQTGWRNNCIVTNIPFHSWVKRLGKVWNSGADENQPNPPRYYQTGCFTFLRGGRVDREHFYDYRLERMGDDA